MANVKISAMTAATAVADTDLIPIVQGGVNKKATRSLLGGYPAGTKIYIALLTQSGTDAPVATVLQNTLGGTVVWGYVTDGQFTGTLAGAFPQAKTYLSPPALDGANASSFFLSRTSDNVVTVFTLDGNGVLLYSSIMILVFP